MQVDILSFISEHWEFTLGLVVTKGFDYFKERYKINTSRTHIATQHAIDEVYNLLGEIPRSVAAVGSVFVMQSHNSGGRPGAGRKYQTSCLYYHGDAYPNIEETWQDRPVGPSLNDLLLATNNCDTEQLNFNNDFLSYSTQGEEEISSKPLGKGSFRDLLKGRGVDLFLVCPLGTNKDEIYSYWLFLELIPGYGFTHKDKSFIQEKALAIKTIVLENNFKYRN